MAARLDSGQLQLDGDTFRDMSNRYPELGPLKELRHSLGQLRLADLAVGPDGRNRVLLSAFRARSGRNQPSNSKSVFGPAVWIRGPGTPRRPASSGMSCRRWTRSGTYGYDGVERIRACRFLRRAARPHANGAAG
jgi:hypothetical protein